MKTFIKKFLFPPLSGSTVSALAASVFGCGLPVFMIHRIKVPGQTNSGICPDHLRRCLSYLAENGYTFVSLEEVVLSLRNQTPLPEKAVVFTMDDGFLEQATVAAPIFLEYNCPLTIFVVTGMLDQVLWPWDAQVSWLINNTEKNNITVDFEDELLSLTLGDEKKRGKAREQLRNIIKEMDAELLPAIIRRLAEAVDMPLPEIIPACYRSMDWDMARELESRGVQFAPHSMTHRILSRLSKPVAEKEIIGSWEKLDSELSRPLKIFCYPTGRALDYGPRETGILKRENFLGAVSTLPGYVEEWANPEDKIYHIPRLVVPNNMMDFIQYCSWIERARMFV